MAELNCWNFMLGCENKIYSERIGKRFYLWRTRDNFWQEPDSHKADPTSHTKGKINICSTIMIKHQSSRSHYWAPAVTGPFRKNKDTAWSFSSSPADLGIQSAENYFVARTLSADKKTKRDSPMCLIRETEFLIFSILSQRHGCG